MASLGLLIVFASLLLATTGVQAKATKTPFIATITVIELGIPERSWVDDDGVQHLRGAPSIQSVTGGITGTLSVVNNVNIDPTGDGDLFGSFVITTAEGVWEGRFSGTFTAGVGSGEFVGQGSGAFEGMKIMGTFSGVAPGVAVLDGIILSPHG